MYLPIHLDNLSFRHLYLEESSKPLMVVHVCSECAPRVKEGSMFVSPRHYETFTASVTFNSSGTSNNKHLRVVGEERTFSDGQLDTPPVTLLDNLSTLTSVPSESLMVSAATSFFSFLLYFPGLFVYCYFVIVIFEGEESIIIQVILL